MPLSRPPIPESITSSPAPKSGIRPPEPPYRYNKVEIEIEGEWHDVTQKMEMSTPTLQDTFQLRFLVENTPVINALVKTHSLSSAISVGIRLEAPRLRMAGTCLARAWDFVMVDDGFLMVLPVSFTWKHRDVEVK